MRAVVGSLVGEVARNRTLRILEVGAGTGSTSVSLLPDLPPDKTLYMFTDISEVFLNKAKQSFLEYPFIRYGLLDIERSPVEQGYGSHVFDAVIAANVLHATQDLERALQNVRSLLAPGGLLLLFETTRHLSYFGISFALIEGWQKFEDDWRRETPLLAAVGWQDILRAQGFSNTAVFPETNSQAEILPNHILLAQAPSADMSSKAFIPAELQTPVRRSKSAPAEEKDIKDDQADEALRQLKEAPPDERLDILVDFVREEVRRVLRRDASRPVGKRHRLMDLGLDSLMAVELRDLLSTKLGLKSLLPATLVFDYPTAEAIAGFLAREILDIPVGKKPEVKQVREVPFSGETITAERIAQLSDEQVEFMLLEKLKMKQETEE